MKKLAKILFYSFILICLGFFAFTNLYHIAHKSADDRYNRDSANKIIAALAEFKKDSNKYPEKLDALVPIYLRKLPALKFFKKPFTYQLTKNQKDFILSYPEVPLGLLPSDGFFAYHSNQRRWDLKIH
ncbi:hypothetical protein ACFL35_01275 [Candidatus Riflebacteria bacterium]